MHGDSTVVRAPGRTGRLSLCAALLLTGGCGTAAGGSGEGPAPLPDDTYRRVLELGTDPALVYAVELPGFELAEQSAGVLGDADYGAVYVPAEPPFDAEVHLEVRAGGYDETRCRRDPLHGPSGSPPVTVEACEPADRGWYRTGGGWQEYVVVADGHHLVLGGPRDAVDRAALTKAALEARRQDGTAISPAPPATPTSPPPRGDLPTTGDGAPLDPHGAGTPGG